MSQSQDTSSIRQYVFDISKVIEGALRGDRGRVLAYAERLRNRFADSGERQAANVLQKLLDGVAEYGVQVSDLAGVTRNLPVDSESRLPIADFDPKPVGSADLVLEPEAQELVDRLISTVQVADRLAAAGVAISSSLLIHGPPGVGKTLLAKAIAERLRLPLLTARTDSLISSYLGSTAKNIRMLFDHAASRPCVLFLDEFDAIGKMRDDSRELGELKRVVISLLQNIDALGPDHVLVAATNHEHLLDSAIWRRFTYKLRLGMPSLESRSRMLRHYLRDGLSASEIEVLARFSEAVSGSDIRGACEEGVRSMVLRNSNTVAFEDVAKAILRSRDNGVGQRTTDEQILELARLLGRAASQEQIGRIVGLSQSKVSRVLKHAESLHA